MLPTRPTSPGDTPGLFLCPSFSPPVDVVGAGGSLPFRPSRFGAGGRCFLARQPVSLAERGQGGIVTQVVIPFNDLRRAQRRRADELGAAVATTLASGWWLNGPELDGFCGEFARYLGVDHVVGVANGTDALEIAMRALLAVRGNAGREVVTVANAGGYSTFACRLVGLTPVYADIEEASQLASLDSVLACVKDETAFIVATHLYGGPVDVPRLRRMLDAAGWSHVPILEDCAQAHGARVGGRMVGGLGDVATFSFYPTKNLGAMGDGGAVATSDPALADAARALRQYGWGRKYEVVTAGGRNSRLDEVQAAVLRVLLPHLDDANARRRAIVRRYAEAAPSGVRMVEGGEGAVGHLAVALCDDRDALRAHLTAAGVGVEVHYPILDRDQPGWRDLPGREAPGGLRASRRSVGRILTLPCFPDLEEDEVDRVCEVLACWRT